MHSRANKQIQKTPRCVAGKKGGRGVSGPVGTQGSEIKIN